MLLVPIKAVNNYALLKVCVPPLLNSPFVDIFKHTSHLVAKSAISPRVLVPVNFGIQNTTVSQTWGRGGGGKKKNL